MAFNIRSLNTRRGARTVPAPAGQAGRRPSQRCSRDERVDAKRTRLEPAQKIGRFC